MKLPKKSVENGTVGDGMENQMDCAVDAMKVNNNWCGMGLLSIRTGRPT